LAATINADTNLGGIGLTATNSSQGILSWSEAFSANPLLSGNNTTTMSATDGGNNTASTNFQPNLKGPNVSHFNYDLNGNTTSDGTNTYKWDAENRLVEIDYPGTGNNSQFTYDGLGRCADIVETRNGTVTSTKQFVWCGIQMCEARDASSAITAQYFSYGQTIGGASLFYPKDHLGSIWGLTDQNGNMQTSYSYDPYGRVTQSQGTPTSDVQYAGYYYHLPSGLNIALRRAYNAASGRWLNRDLVGETGGINLYNYVRNSPINFSDPLGMAI